MNQVTITADVVTKQYAATSRGEPRREWEALRLLSTAQPGLTPTPLTLGGSTLTMTRVPGSPLGGALTPQELDALESALAELWSVAPDGLLAVGPLAQRVRADLRHSSTTRPTAAPSGSTPESGADGTISEWWGDTRAAALSWLDGPAAAELGRPGVVGMGVVGHGDPNLANYLWDGERVRIVDFEDSGRSDLAWELANLVEHIASRRTRWEGFAERFEVEAERFHAARCLWAIFWLTMLGPGGPAEGRNPPGTGRQQAERVLDLLRR